MRVATVIPGNANNRYWLFIIINHRWPALNMDKIHNNAQICDLIMIFQDGSRLSAGRACRRSLRMQAAVAHGINEWSCLHEWNTSSTPRPLQCDFNTGSGYFEIKRPCLQNLLPINMTCSNKNSGNHKL